MTLSLNRVILFVQNVEQLKDFYRQHFYFEPAEEIKDQWVVLKTGNCEIALHKAGAMVAANDHKGGNNNVKLVFCTTTDLYQLRATLIDNKVTMREVLSFGDPNYLFCDGMDPEGNVFQIMQQVG